MPRRYSIIHKSGQAKPLAVAVEKLADRAEAAATDRRGPRVTGKIVCYETTGPRAGLRGQGWVKPDAGGDDVMVRAEQLLLPGVSLKAGDRVEYAVAERRTRQGKQQALAVTKIERNGLRRVPRAAA